MSFFRLVGQGDSKNSICIVDICDKYVHHVVVRSNWEVAGLVGEHCSCLAVCRDRVTNEISSGTYLLGRVHIF